MAASGRHVYLGLSFASLSMTAWQTAAGHDVIFSDTKSSLSAKIETAVYGSYIYAKRTATPTTTSADRT
jgi:hypothetical protein